MQRSLHCPCSCAICSLGLNSYEVQQIKNVYDLIVLAFCYGDCQIWLNIASYQVCRNSVSCKSWMRQRFVWLWYMVHNMFITLSSNIYLHADSQAKQQHIYLVQHQAVATNLQSYLALSQGQYKPQKWNSQRVSIEYDPDEQFLADLCKERQ